MMDDLQEIQEMAQEMEKPQFSDDHLIGSLRTAAEMYGSEDMQAELAAAADRLEAMARELRSYQKFENDISAALGKAL